MSTATYLGNGKFRKKRIFEKNVFFAKSIFELKNFMIDVSDHIKFILFHSSFHYFLGVQIYVLRLVPDYLVVVI